MWLFSWLACLPEELPPRNCAERHLYYADPDGDGFGSPEDVYVGCEAPEGYATVASAAFGHSGVEGLHSGTPTGPSGHTGEPASTAQTGHTGAPAPTGHTGHTGDPAHTGHTGDPAHTGHTGDPATGHTGDPATGHTGLGGHTGAAHTGL